jgi:hypothetical protein
MRVAEKLCMCAIRGTRKKEMSVAALNTATSSPGERQTSRSPVASSTGTSMRAASAATTPGSIDTAPKPG